MFGPPFRTYLQKLGRGRPAAIVALVGLLSSLLVFLTQTPAQAVTAFSSRYQANVSGDITLAANHNLTCTTGCTTANSGTMAYVDVDGTAASPLAAGGTVATFNSSTADVVVPAGSTILFAGLFWGGNLASGANQGGTGGANAPTPANMNRVYFRTPALTGYTTVTALAADVDTDGVSNATFPIYHAFADVTALVQAVPIGGLCTYSVADIQAGTGSSGSGDWGGWTLAVAYTNPAEHLRNLNIFNGFNRVTGTTDVDIPFGPFITPVVGPVKLKIGLVAQDGDPGIVGDAATLGAGLTNCLDTNPLLSDAANTNNNIFNSSISKLGTNVTTRNPAAANTWGYDADIIQADNVLPNGTTNACLRLKTNGDQYFPDAVTTAIELPAPLLVATKTGVDLNGGTLNPGDTIEYTITIQNNGDDIATDVVMVDPVPSQLTYTPGTIIVSAGANAGAKTDAAGDDQARFATGSVTVNLGTGATAVAGGQMLPAASTQVKFRATVNSNIAGGTLINNTVQISYKGATIPTQVIAPVSSATTSAVAAQVDLQVSKTDSQTVVSAGSAITYVMTVRNNGPQTATNSTFTDTIPAIILSPTWTCSVAGQSAAASCGAASGAGSINTTLSLGSGDTATYTVTGTVDPAAAAGTATIVNTATAAVTGNQTDTNTANNSATDTDDTVRRADIQVTKTDGITNAVPGTAITYTVAVTNAGPSNAGSVSVVDTVPAALTGITWTCSATAGSSCTAASGSGNSISTSANLNASGVATYVINGTLNPATPAGTNTLVNTATATLGPGITEINAANNTATDTDNVTPRADLSITKTDGIVDAVPGTTVTYTISVANAGPSTANNALVTDSVPASLTGVTWTCAATGPGASCGAASGSGNSISTTATLPSGTSATYTVTATLNPTTPSGTGTLSNTATVAAPSGTTDPSAGNNSATDIDNVRATAELSITKTDGAADVVPGSPHTYTIVVTNAGPSTVTNATITDAVPASLTGVTWTCIAGAGATCGAASGSGNSIATTATLAAGASVTYTVTGTLAPTTASGTLTNTAATALPSGVTDPTPGATQATDNSTIRPTGDLSITKTDGMAAAVPGTNITYTVVITNGGPSTATNALVTDTLPATITGVTWTCAPSGAGAACGAASGSGNTLSTTATLPSSTSVTYTITGTLDPSTVSGTGTLVNSASVAAPAGFTDNNSANNSATDTDDVTAQADLAVTKTASVPSVLPGGAVGYTIVVTNNGPSNVTGASIVDSIPSQLVGTTWTCSAGAGATCGTASGSGNGISITANLNSGSSVTLNVSSTVGGNIPAGTINNTATATVPSGVTDPVPGNNSASVLVTIDSATDLSITKTDGVSSATPGSTVTYTIVASNGGPNAVSGATVADTMPANISASSWSCAASAGSSCATSSGTGSFSIGVNLALGGTATFTVTATVGATATGSLANTATITVPSGVTETNSANNSATDTDTLSPVGDLSITKTDGATTAIPGNSITYTITVQNSGPSTATAAQIADTIPAGITGATWTCSSSGASSCSAPSGTGNIATTATVASGSAVVYSVTGTIAPGATGTLSNTATVTPPSGFPDSNATNNSATDSDTLVPQGDLSISKTNGATQSIPGTATTYTIVASNSGPSTVVNAPITDSLPASLTGATWTCSASAGSSPYHE